MKFAGYLLLLAIPLPARAAEIPLSKHDFIVIAHRGNHGNAYENTLTALQNAIDAGADYAEIDVRRTSDAHHALMHDQTVDRMTDGHGSVKQLTLSQLQQLQVRDLRRPQIDADRIPTFKEALQLVRGPVARCLFVTSPPLIRNISSLFSPDTQPEKAELFAV